MLNVSLHTAYRRRPLTYTAVHQLQSVVKCHGSPNTLDYLYSLSKLSYGCTDSQCNKIARVYKLSGRSPGLLCLDKSNAHLYGRDIIIRMIQHKDRSRKLVISRQYERRRVCFAFCFPERAFSPTFWLVIFREARYSSSSLLQFPPL